MAKIFSTFADHAAAQRAVDQLHHAGFAPSDVYIDPASQRDLLASGAARSHDADAKPDHERQGVLQSIGHAVASVAGLHPPAPRAQPTRDAPRPGGRGVGVGAGGAAAAARAAQLLRSAGGMDVHRAGQRAPAWGRGGGAAAQEEDSARNADAERRRTVERALAADQANSERAWDPDTPPAAAGDRPCGSPR